MDFFNKCIENKVKKIFFKKNKKKNLYKATRKFLLRQIFVLYI